MDLNDRNASHTLIVELAGEGKAVLDVGAATGYVSQALAGRGCRVTGLELDAESARKAEEFCERVVVGDVESLDLDAELERGSFDVIVFGDVLEHLRDPRRTLERIRPFLAPEGYVVASIPNIAHGSVRLALMQGRFEYRSLGLLDDTHLRFFTRESIEEMFAGAGFVLGELRRTTAGILETEVEVDRARITDEMLASVREDPESETYQFVLSAHPVGADGSYSRLSNRARLLAEELDRRDEAFHEMNRKLRDHEDLERRLAGRERQISDMSKETTRLNQRLAGSEQALEIMTGQAAETLRGLLNRARGGGG